MHEIRDDGNGGQLISVGVRDARVNLDISVAYDTDIDAATDLINRVGEEMQADEEWGPRLLEAPKVMRVNALADSAVTLKVPTVSARVP